MLLLTVREWFGPSREGAATAAAQGRPVPASEVKHRGFVTNKPLGQAIQYLSMHEDAYCSYFTATAIELALLQVSVIDDLNDYEIELARMRLVESLPLTVEQMKDSGV